MAITVLVASATANTGSKVVEQLSASGKATIRALVRNPDSDVAKALAAAHVTVVKGDFNDPASLKAPLAGVQRAFLVSSPGEDAQYDREVAFIAAATEAGVEAVVRVSTYNPLIDLNTACVYARAHARIEKYVDEHGSNVIDLQPSWFMSNLLWQAAEIKATRKLSYPVTHEEAKSGPPFAAIDPRDVASAAVAVLLSSPEELATLLAAKRLEVHGPEVNQLADHLAAVAEASGKPVQLNPISREAHVELLVAAGLSRIMAESFTDTIRTVAGSMKPYRPIVTQTAPALAAIWQPKYTIAQWAQDNAAAFA